MKQAIRKIKAIGIPLKVPSDYSLSEIGMTQSLLSNFCLCEQRFVYAVNKWKPKKSSSALVFGSLIHELLDKTYTLYDRHKKIALSTQIDNWIELFFEEEKVVGIQPDEIEFMKTKAYIMITNYILHWKADFGGKKFEQIEKTDSVMLDAGKEIENDNTHDIDVLFRFKKDGLYLDKQHDRWIMESKCYSRIEEEVMAKTLLMDFQNLTYTLTEIELNQKPVKGVLRNILRNPGNKLNATDNLKTFADRLDKEMKKKPDYYFMRYEIPYSKKDIETFKQSFFKLLCRLNAFILKNLSQKGGTPERNYCACEGKYLCPYIDACISGNMIGYEQKENLFSELIPKEV